MKKLLSLLLISCLFMGNYMVSMESGEPAPKKPRIRPDIQPSSQLPPKEVPDLKDLSITNLAAQLVEANYHVAKKLADELFNTLPTELTQPIIMSAIKKEFAQPWTKQNYKAKFKKVASIYLPVLSSTSDQSNETIREIIFNYLNRAEYRYDVLSQEPIMLTQEDNVKLFYDIIKLPHIDYTKQDLTKKNLLNSIENNNLSAEQKWFIDALPNSFFFWKDSNILNHTDYLHQKKEPLGLEVEIDQSGNKPLRSLWGFEELIQNPQEITKLIIFGTELTTLPPEIGMFTNLRDITIYLSRIIEFPAEVKKLTNLRTLIIQGAQKTTFPLGIGKFTNLTQLKLIDSRLTTLAPEIGRLTNLQILDLGRNQLTTLPPEIVSLTNLVSLDLSVNQLTTLPPEIGMLTNLQQLYLIKNALTNSTFSPKILQAIRSLPKLRMLDLSSNQISRGKLEEIRRALPNNVQIRFN